MATAQLFVRRLTKQTAFLANPKTIRATTINGDAVAADTALDDALCTAFITLVNLGVYPTVPVLTATPMTWSTADGGWVYDIPASLFQPNTPLQLNIDLYGGVGLSTPGTNELVLHRDARLDETG